jgi:hypothetical protein
MTMIEPVTHLAAPREWCVEGTRHVATSITIAGCTA